MSSFKAGRVNMVKVWTEPTVGAQPCFSTPDVNMNYHSPSFSGPVVLYCAYDGFFYARDAKTGNLLWSYQSAGQCYGRPTSGDVNFDGNTESFFASHDGHIYSFDSLGNKRWAFANLYIREGHNDGIFWTDGDGNPQFGGTTAAGGSITSSTSTTLVDNSQNWGMNSFIRGILGQNSSVKITAGTGAGATLYEINTAVGDTITFQPAVVFPATDATSRYQVIPKYGSDAYYQHAGTIAQETDNQWFLYITGFDGTCCKIDADSGALIWQFHSLENNEPFPLLNTVAGIGYTCFFSSIDKNVYALNAETGAKIWATSFPEPLDAFLAIAPVHGDGVLKLLVNGRRSGNSAGGRCSVLDAATGDIEFQSPDQLGDLDSVPLALPRTWDTTGKYNIYFAGDSAQPTMIDDTGRLLWQDTRGDTSGLQSFNSSPVASDVNLDGFDEIFHCNQSGIMCIYTQAGARFATFGSNGGVEGTPSIINLYGDGNKYAMVPELAGFMTLYQFVVT